MLSSMSFQGPKGQKSPEVSPRQNSKIQFPSLKFLLWQVEPNMGGYIFPLLGEQLFRAPTGIL